MIRPFLRSGLLGLLLVAGCSAGADPGGTNSSAAGGSTDNGAGGAGGGGSCPSCDGTVYTDCDGETTDCNEEGLVCTTKLGCAVCAPELTRCLDEGTVAVEKCRDDGSGWDVVETCAEGTTCSNGRCRTACEAAEDQPSNVGCEFWAVDLDQQDGLGFDPASEPWGLALSNVGNSPASVVVEINNAEPGAAPDISTALTITVQPGTLEKVILPTRELDCGVRPNDYGSPGTCLSSKAFRVRSTFPIVVTQFNVFENSYSNDASLLIPTSTLGQTYRVIGWNAGHPAPIDIPGFEVGIDRSYITVVGTTDGTHVRVKPSWKIRGNPPIAATPAGGEITATLNAFDVLNLETDDGTLQDGPTVADLSGSAVYSDKPIAVFSGVESTLVPYGVEIPTYPGWDDAEGGGESCCLDHMEEQLFPVESAGTNYVVTASPNRSSGWRDPDVIRFVGAAEPATITTTLTTPGFQSFIIQPGEVKTTYTQGNFTATGDKPFLLGQFTVSQGYTTRGIGDPDFTVFPPAEQQRNEYIILTPPSWTENWVVIAAETGTSVTIDGAAPAGCLVEAAGTVLGVTYESRTCPLQEGKHALSGDKPFQIIAYGYAGAGSYAFVGGADVKKIYEPPPPPN